MKIGPQWHASSSCAILIGAKRARKIHKNVVVVFEHDLKTRGETNLATLSEKFSFLSYYHH